jgi:UPF0755 protein
MTEYGRGQGSEPWHPGDPYYGDDGWGGQHPQGQQQFPYGGQPQQYPEQDPYGGQDQQHYGQQDQQQYEQQHQQQYGGDWGTGQQPPYGAGHDPYAQQHQQHPHQQHQQHQQPYDDGYGTQQAYQEQGHQQQGHQQQGYQQQGDGRPGAGQDRPDWDAEPEEERHPFFTGADDEGDDHDDRPGRRARGGRSDRRGRDEGRRGRGGDRDEGRRGRGGCLIGLLVVGAVVVGGGYYLYQERFAAAPDFSGDGNGTAVSITIPPGSTGAEVGRILKEKGIVKSVDGFVAALTDSGGDLQAGAYQLEEEMSAETAVEWLLAPGKSGAKGLVVTEGMRNADIYKAIDKKLKLDAGTTEKIAEEKSDTLGLPEWAADSDDIKDPLEGFLFPATYPAADDTKPEDLLKDMVKRSTEIYKKHEVDTRYKEFGLDSPLELVTVASLVQAEGISHDDFKQMAEVIYNRLSPDNTETYGKLEFDSSYNYFKNQHELDISAKDLRGIDNPYNTHYHRGLPPGPIGNPGEDAITGAMAPTDQGWYYFISLDGKTSKFSKTYAEHEKLVQQFQKQLREEQ